MAQPSPLTASEPPNIDWSRPGTPAAREFGDIYFSTDGGLAESEAVFLRGCHLPEAWRGQKLFTIGETGFGTGLNFLATWRLWADRAAPQARLHFISVEKYPLSRDELARALVAFPELKSWSEQLIMLWPDRVKGIHRLEFGPVTLTLIHDDVVRGLADISGRVDAWYLDGFSPAKNPDMWSSEVIAQIARLSAPGARLASFTVAGSVRAALTSAGFDVEKKEGFGRKRSRLEARFRGRAQSGRPPKSVKPVIIGGGIGGASLARAFSQRGIRAVVIDPMDGTAASGNAAAIVKPRLDVQDRPESRFFLESYLYAISAYAGSGAVRDDGVYQIAKNADEVRRFERLAGQAALPTWHMALRSSPYGQTSLYFPRGQVIDPEAALRQFMGASDICRGRAAALIREAGTIAVKDESGQVLARGTHIVWAIGAGTRHTKLVDGLRYSRGQISWGREHIDKALTYGGYAIGFGEDMLLGATHDRVALGDPYVVKKSDDMRNLDGFEAISGFRPAASSRPSRAAIRVTQATTLPMMAALGQQEHAMSALGSRGFVFAPLMAQIFVSNILGETVQNLPNSICKAQAG